MRYLFLALCSLFLGREGLAQALTPAPAPSEKLIADFAASVLPHYRSDFHKWGISPQLSCIGEAADLAPCKPFVERFVSETNAILAGLPIQVVLLPDNMPTANYRVYVGRKAEIARIRRANGAGSNWESQIRWNAEKLIENYSVYVDLDECVRWDPLYQRRNLFRRLFTGIGFSGGEVKGVPSFYADSKSEPMLTEYDRKLIRFAYEHLLTGATPTDIRQTVRKKWELVRLPGQ